VEADRADAQKVCRTRWPIALEPEVAADSGRRGLAPLVWHGVIF
jgi:hypothetical protein